MMAPQTKKIKTNTMKTKERKNIEWCIFIGHERALVSENTYSVFCFILSFFFFSVNLLHKAFCFFLEEYIYVCPYRCNLDKIIRFILYGILSVSVLLLLFFVSPSELFNVSDKVLFPLIKELRNKKAKSKCIDHDFIVGRVKNWMR